MSGRFIVEWIHSRRGTLIRVTRKIAIAGIALLAGCEQQVAFPPVVGAVRAVVVRNSQDTLLIITDSARLVAIQTFVNKKSADWRVQVEGVPVAPIVMSIYTTAGFERGIGIGADFLTQYREAGTWASLRTSPAERSEAEALFGLTQGK